MKTWQKIVFIIILVTFISASVTISLVSMARAPFEYEYRTVAEDNAPSDGWVLFGFNGNNNTKKVYIDYVRDADGNDPDETKPVSSVGRFTMNADDYVEEIYIGKDVKFIDETSFFNCKALRSVEVHEENEYYTDVDGVLYTKDMKTLLLYPLMKETENSSFTIPEGVERIGSCVFYKNESLKEINLPSTLKEIGNMAFFKCKNMGLVTLPNGLKKIGTDAFSYCQGLSPLMYIPASVEEIGSYAFYSCENISEMYMGAESEDDLITGNSWMPKNVSKVVIYVAADAQYGKTRDDAEKRIEELIREGEEN